MPSQRPDLTALEEEAAELRARVARLADDRVRIEEDLARTRRRLSQVYYEMGRLYEHSGTLQTPVAEVPIVPAVQIPFNEPVSAPTKKPYGNAKAAVRVVTEILRASGGPMRTLALLDELQKRGITVEGPMAHHRLANWLSKSAEVKNSRVGGWHLAEWPAQPPGLREALEVRLPADGRVFKRRTNPKKNIQDDPAASPSTIQRGFIKNLNPERHRERTLQGLEAARAKGIRGGRRLSIPQEKWDEVKRLLTEGFSARAAAAKVGISDSMVHKKMPQLLEEMASTAGHPDNQGPEGDGSH